VKAAVAAVEFDAECFDFRSFAVMASLLWIHCVTLGRCSVGFAILVVDY